MCCDLGQISARLVVDSVKVGKEGSDKKKFSITATVDRAPATWGDWALRNFQRLELLEKIAEIADESFHLFGSLLKEFSSAVIFQTFRNLHHAAHDIEHFLHSICFLGDISRIATGNFFEYVENKETHKKEISYLLTAARVAHTVSHFFATLKFLADHHLIRAERFGRVFTFMPYLSAAGYGIWTISLIARRVMDQATVGERNQFVSDLGIHLGGFFFQAVPLINNFSLISNEYHSIINKIASFAGIITAWCVAYRLLPQDKERVNTEYIQGNAVKHDHAKCHH